MGRLLSKRRFRASPTSGEDMMMTPPEVVDYALELTRSGRCKGMVVLIGDFADWSPQLLHRAHNEAVRRSNLATNRGALNYDDRQAYNGVVNALALAYDRAISGPPRGRRKRQASRSLPGSARAARVTSRHGDRGFGAAVPGDADRRPGAGLHQGALTRKALGGNGASAHRPHRPGSAGDGHRRGRRPTWPRK